MSAESGIGWSPNGRRIAATYLYPTGAGEDDVATATVVLDLAGDEVAHLESVNLVPPNNGGWIDDDRILTHPEVHGRFALDGCFLAGP